MALPRRRWYQRVRSAFLAGLLVGTPLAVTIWILILTVSFLEQTIELLPEAIQPHRVLGFHIPGLGIILALSTVLLIGFATRSYIGARAIEAYENILGRLPVVSSIYQGVKQLLEALFLSGQGHFQQVVLVEYPRRGLYAVAFRTGEAFLQRDDGTRMVNIFLPTTPNPTSGFYLLLPEDDVIDLDITIEQAFKLIMSAGLVQPPARHLRTPAKAVIR